MDIDFLKSLLLTVEVGSIAEAARRQNLTAAAVGQRIRALERELGKPLVEKVGVSSKPTSACQAILQHIRALVEDTDALVERLDETGLTGTLRIGAIATQVTDTIPYILEPFNQRCPRIHLHIVPGTSQQLYEALKNDQLDLALMVTPDFALPKSQKAVPFLSEGFVIITSKQQDLPLTDIMANLPYIRYDPASWGGKIVDSYLSKMHVTPNVMCDLDSLETIAVMVGNGMGFSIVPNWTGLERHRSRLHVAPLDALELTRDISLCYNIPVRLPNAIDVLVDMYRTGSATLARKEFAGKL